MGQPRNTSKGKERWANLVGFRKKDWAFMRKLLTALGQNLCKRLGAKQPGKVVPEGKEVDACQASRRFNGRSHLQHKWQQS